MVSTYSPVKEQCADHRGTRWLRRAAWSRRNATSGHAAPIHPLCSGQGVCRHACWLVVALIAYPERPDGCDAGLRLDRAYPRTALAHDGYASRRQHSHDRQSEGAVPTCHAGTWWAGDRAGRGRTHGGWIEREPPCAPPWPERAPAGQRMRVISTRIVL